MTSKVAVLASRGVVRSAHVDGCFVRETRKEVVYVLHFIPQGHGRFGALILTPRQSAHHSFPCTSRTTPHPCPSPSVGGESSQHCSSSLSICSEPSQWAKSVYHPSPLRFLIVCSPKRHLAAMPTMTVPPSHVKVGAAEQLEFLFDPRGFPRSDLCSPFCPVCLQFYDYRTA